MANEKCWIASWNWLLLQHSLPRSFAVTAAIAAVVGAVTGAVTGVVGVGAVAMGTTTITFPATVVGAISGATADGPPTFLSNM